MFHAGRFDELVKGGYVKLIKEDSVVATPPDANEVEINVKPVEHVQQGVKEKQEREASTPEDAKVDPPVITLNIDDTTRREMMDELDKRGVKYSKNASKEELYAKFRESKK